jgi:DNA processing protein
MNERGLLDLSISLLPDLKITDKLLLLQAFDNEEKLFVQSKGNIEEILNHALSTFWDITEIHEKAGRIDTICRMRSIKWVSWADADYPPLLRESYDPPVVLFYQGKLPNPEKSLLGMVGTRHPSPQSSEQAYKIAGNIGKAGISVISGLALGIDAMSHRGSLIGSAPGYAVLGSGIDEVYPSVNRPLARRILDSGGALMSEYPPGVRPAKWRFPARNRIIAAMSRGVLVVEAPQKSGALITAAFALEQGKDIWVASCGLSSGLQEDGKFDKRGTMKLANDGAEVINSACDVLEKWNIETGSSFAKRAEESNTGMNDYINSLADFLKIEM